MKGPLKRLLRALLAGVVGVLIASFPQIQDIVLALIPAQWMPLLAPMLAALFMAIQKWLRGVVPEKATDGKVKKLTKKVLTRTM